MTKIDKTQLATERKKCDDSVYGARVTMNEHICDLYKLRRAYAEDIDLLQLSHVQRKNVQWVLTVAIETIIDNLEEYPEE